MRYLRMLTNALVAGALSAAYVIVLVLLLNPSLPTAPRSLGPLVWSIGAYYTAGSASIAYLLLLLRRLFGRASFSPAWMSVTVLAWLGSVTAGAGAGVFWLNIRSYALVLEARMTTALAQGVIVLTAAAMLFLIIALLQRYGGRRVVWAAWLTTIAVASVTVPLVLRGRGTPAPPVIRPAAAGRDVAAAASARVTVIAIEGGSLELIAAAAAEGRLPNIGRLLDTGATMHLATLRPTSSEAVWAAISTGKLPQKNGIRSAAVYRLAGHPQNVPVQLLPDYCFASALIRSGILEEERQTSASLQATPLWTALSRAGISVGLVNVPLTHPPPPVEGFVVSDGYARMGPGGVTMDATHVSPHAIAHDVRSAATAALGAGDGAIAATLAVMPERHRGAARTDRMLDAIGRALHLAHPTQVSVTRFESPDTAGHYFLRYARPASFGDVSEEDRRRLGGVLEAHYALVDEAVGRAVGGLGPDDLLFVISGFGIEPLGIGKRILERLVGDSDVSGTHEAAPDGFLIAYGGQVARAGQLRRGSVVDVAPTLLYFLGLPIGRDMDGFARVDLFQSAFTGERPMTFIPTYDR
ncbi:MAG: alkaline phosphatase family protein [Vicinamibacterales bacterium]